MKEPVEILERFVKKLENSRRGKILEQSGRLIHVN